MKHAQEIDKKEQLQITQIKPEKIEDVKIENTVIAKKKYRIKN